MKSSLTASLSLSAIAAIGCATVSLLVSSHPAQAFTLGCAAVITNNVTDSVACGMGATEQDWVSPNQPLTVNTENFFGFSNWQFGGKIGTGSYAATGDGWGQSGQFDLSANFKSSWEEVMLVFKSGNNTTLVGYLLQDGVTAGSWTSPFDSSVFTVPDARDVSHISVYYREGNSTAVPEPMTMAGMALAGAGFAAYRHRRTVAAKR